MAVWPKYGPVTPSVISFLHAPNALRSFEGTYVNTAWGTANLARFWPVFIPEPFVVTKFFWVNGTVSGNVDMGFYTTDGVRLISTGSTAMSGANAVQTVDVTDTLIPDGLLYLAMAVDNNTGTFAHAGSVSSSAPELGCFQMATAFALPATATFAQASPTAFRFYKCGALKYPRTII